MTLIKCFEEFSLPEKRERSSEELLKFGLVVVDKSSGPTSHDTVHHVKKFFNLKKAGHSGTLDPKVTGVLPTGVGKATRLLGYLLKAPKEYVCLMKLHDEVSDVDLDKCFKKFSGEIDQLVPRKSRVKRRVRKRTIYELELLDRDGSFVLFRALTQAGTYIRKLIHDMGEFLKTGAHMLELRRTRVAHLKEVLCVDLYELLMASHELGKNNDVYVKQFFFSGEKLVEHLPRVFVFDSAVTSLSHGSSLKIPGLAAFDDSITNGCDVAVFDLKGNLVMVGIAQLSVEQVLKQKTGVFVKPSCVIV
ncbi:MAG: RNA-guided pseudouridylation complex pseudouridine synthase subunit Cbf5 [Nanoarchaeota archaeon]|nr:RNA-guided pseudouridylation complex pseudouridine synthase subunit Cbf5 [Nanoarchaeota archaeon]